jgi:cytidylate kinase
MGTILDRLEHRPYEAMSSRSEAVYLDGADVTHLVWSDQCNGVLPWVSESDDLRGQILEFNRKMVVSPMVVAGRDVAPTLLPDARPKIYLDASYSVRRLRRRAQVGAGGFGTPVAGPKSKIDLATREYVASDPSGLIIDTSDLAIEEVRKRVLERASE